MPKLWAQAALGAELACVCPLRKSLSVDNNYIGDRQRITTLENNYLLYSPYQGQVLLQPVGGD